MSITPVSYANKNIYCSERKKQTNGKDTTRKTKKKEKRLVVVLFVSVSKLFAAVGFRNPLFF